MSSLWATASAVAVGAAAVALRNRPAPSRRHAAPASSPASSPSSQFLDALDLLVLCIRAGMLPIEAMRVAGTHVGPAVRVAFGAVLEQVGTGTRFADALESLPRLLGPQALLLADTLAAADRDGLPLAPVLERLSVESRAQRRRDADARARQLPVRLAFPLVLCSLPAFVLLAVTPMLIAALSALTR